ncbi:MAG: hypothetical protein ACTH1O_10125 [Brachybacterium sp.]
MDTTDSIALRHNEIFGPVELSGTVSGAEMVVSGSKINGSLSCRGNDTAVTDKGTVNTIVGRVSVDCAALGRA